jgi:hypothetical protein
MPFGTLVDSNVLLDHFTDDPRWGDWSATNLAATFDAGRCFQQYRRGGGTRRSPLPDFYIAAHAATTGRTLLTRDRPRHVTYLPALRVVAPD